MKKNFFEPVAPEIAEQVKLLRDDDDAAEIGCFDSGCDDYFYEVTERLDFGEVALDTRGPRYVYYCDGDSIFWVKVDEFEKWRAVRSTSASATHPPTVEGMTPRTFSKLIENAAYELRKFKDEHGEGYEVFCPSELGDQPLGMVPAGGNIMRNAQDMIAEFRRRSPGLPRPTKANIRLVEGGGQPGFDVPIDPIEGDSTDSIRKVFMASDIATAHRVAADQEIEVDINWSDDQHAKSEVWDLVFAPLIKNGDEDELISMARSYGILR